MKLAFAAAALMASACVVGEFGDDDNVTTLAAVHQDTLKRVVLARLYQKEDFTLPHAGATVAERVQYACTRLRQLHPTYVSGLLRLDEVGPISAEQIAVFTGVRDCVRGGGRTVKFDVVLNAEHYTDNDRQPSRDAGLEALKARARDIQQQLGPDIIFFDYFSTPYNDEHKAWYQDALTLGTRYIRNTLGMKVGGNVWGLTPPPNADFIALDNFDREIDGFAFNQKQIAAFKGYPIVLHIENNPDKLTPSKGLQFINGSPEYRRDVVNRFADLQRSAGFSYMFPLFFPLQCCAQTTAGYTCGPETCNIKPSDRIAYDASRDGTMMQKIDEGLAK